MLPDEYQFSLKFPSITSELKEITIMSDLLKEALADAKAVRATALANAKVALEEAFGERIQSMFAERLKNEVAAEEENVVPSGIGHGDNKKPVQEPKTSNGSQKFGSMEEEGHHTDDPGHSVGHVAGSMEEEGSEEITDRDLEEIIAELEKEGGLEEEGEVAPADPTAVAPAVSADPTAVAPAVSADTTAVSPMAPAVSADPTAVVPCDPNAVAPVAPVVPADPNAVAPVAPVAEEEMEEINLDELLAELEGEEGKEGSEEDNGGMHVDESAWEEQLQEVTAERDEAMKTVQILRNQINEVNLLNAKLLYTNKLFKQYSLNNQQKMKVVENFDLTTNVREVKLTYAIMAESFNLGGSVVKKKNTTATTITEGLASKAVASTKPSQEIVSGGNKMAERFKTLAGINK